MSIQFIRARDLAAHVPEESMHIHTDFTDGEASVLEVINRASEKKLERIALTEHVSKASGWYDPFMDEVIRSRRKKAFSKMRIYFGIEARAVDYAGRLNASRSMVDCAEIVMGVVHRYPREAGEAGDDVYEMHELDAGKALELEYKALLYLLDHPQIHILGHIGGTYCKHFGEPPDAFYREIIKKAAGKDIAIEVNPTYLRNLPAFLEICFRFNPWVSIGDNAHKLDEIGTACEKIRHTVRMM